MTIFRFFKMAAAVILHCKIFEILMVKQLKRAKMRRCAKFGRNQSNRSGDMTDFSIFQNGGRRHLVFLIFFKF